MDARKTLRIARWEATRGVGGVDRRTAVALVVVLLLLGGLVPAIMAAPPTPGAGIYRIGVAEENPYYPVVATDGQLRAVDPHAELGERADVVVREDRILVANSEKGRAALAALRAAVQQYNDRLMASEEDRAAAFPVRVTLRYVEQSVTLALAGGNAGTDDGTGTGDGETATDGGQAGTTAADSGTDDGGGTGDQKTPTDGGQAGTTDGTGTDGVGTDGGAGTDDRQTATDGGEVGTDGGASDVRAPLQGTTRDGPAGLFGGAQSGTPGSIAPPFPLRSLLLAFVFLLPLNVVIQTYGSSVIAERINRRGEPLLVSPVSPGDVVVGKALPYFAGALAIVAAIGLVVGAGPVAVAALAPLVALFLAATFLGGMLARSYKELTFVTVTISVGLTAYAFVPAVFTEVHPIASISPLSLVVRDIQGTPVAPGGFVLATLPVALAAAVLYVLGTGLYREEYMFTQRSIPAKLLDALAAPLRSKRRVALWTALFIPFVLVAELFAIAVLFVVPAGLALPVLLGAVAIVEEVAKSLHVYAGFARDRFDRTLGTALAVGAFSGLGFFVGEKLTLLTQLVGLPELQLGQAAFAQAAAGLSPLLLLAAPLVLHVVTAAISAVGASRSRPAYLLALAVAAAVHVAYNLAVVTRLA